SAGSKSMRSAGRTSRTRLRTAAARSPCGSSKAKPLPAAMSLVMSVSSSVDFPMPVRPRMCTCAHRSCRRMPKRRRWSRKSVTAQGGRTMSSTIVYASSDSVTREQLKSIAPPPGTATWKPIPHYDLVHALDRQLAVREIAIVREQFALVREGARLFGLLEVEVPGITPAESYRFALGLRAANDKSEAITIVAGAVAFACTNMPLS